MGNDHFYMGESNSSQGTGLLDKVGLEDDTEFWTKMVASYTSPMD